MAIDYGRVVKYELDDAVLHNNADEVTTSTNSWVKRKETKLTHCPVGTLRIQFQLKSGNGSYNAEARIYRNGEAVGTSRSTSNTAYQTYTEDIAGWSDGDLLQLYNYQGSGYSYAHVANLKVLGKYVAMSERISGYVSQDP